MKSNALSAKTKVMVYSGMLIALSVVFKLVLEIYIPLGGFPSLRLNLTTIPIMLSGFLFGPVSGCVTGIASDLLCYLIKPNGPYFFGFTLVSALIGFIPGLLYSLLKKHPLRRLEYFNLIFLIISIGLLIYFKVFSIHDGSFYYQDDILHPVLVALFIIIMIGFAIFPVIVVRKQKGTGFISTEHLVFIINITQIICSIILNTWFLTILYGQAASVLLPARIIANIFLIPVYTLILIPLLKILSPFAIT